AGRWCFSGKSGRREALPRCAPRLILMSQGDRGAAALRRVLECSKECGYLEASESELEPGFHAAPIEEWRRRFLKWVDDPISEKIYLARPFFDLRPLDPIDPTWKSLEHSVLGAITPEFLHVVANDCLSALPPMTFFQNVVLDDAGEE